MSSKSIPIRSQGLYAQSKGLDIKYKESENDLSTNCSSYSNSTIRMDRNSSVHRRSISSSFYLTNEKLLLPFLSSIYTEIITHWSHINWLHFSDNQQMTFLVLNSKITDYLTVQTALDNKQFIISKLPLLYQPECLLIRTEYDHQSLLSPNSIISLKCLFSSRENSYHGKLMAIICQNKTMKIMFYKAISTDYWAVFFKDLKNSSQSSANILSYEQQRQLYNILEQDTAMNLTEPTQLSFPLSALYKHPIIFVYIVQ